MSPYLSCAFLAYVLCTWYKMCVSSERAKISTPDVGARIREAREGLGLSQVRFAEKIGQAERTVQAWEANDRTPRLSALLGVASATERPVAFFYGEGEKEAA